MTPREPQTQPLETWSEARLGALFASLPRLEPGAGFVDRVMAALPPRSAFDSAWARGAVAASLLVVAVAAALFVPAAVSLARLAGPATILGIWVSAVADLFGALGESFGAWDRLASFARALGLALAQPKALALLAANFGLAFVAFRGLVALTPALPPNRSSAHVSIAS